MDAVALAARFETILGEYGAALRRVAAGYERDPGRREDLFQEIGLALWQALPGFRGECSERTFVYRIAHNRGLTHATRRRPAPVPLETAGGVADPAPDPETAAHAAQGRRRLEAAILALPLSLRQVLTLALEGLKGAEIGEVLGLSESNVAVRLHRARKMLRQILEERP